MNRKILGLVLAVSASVACGPTVEQLCDAMDECVPNEECRADGEALERSADDAGCSDPFDAYLECIDDARCEWEDRCEIQRSELESCVELPP